MNTSPFFIVGVDRSGTTLLTLLLDGHSQLWIPNESHFFVSYFEKYMDSESFADDSFREKIVKDILNEKYVSDWAVSVSLDEVDLSSCTDLPATIAAVYTAHARKEGKLVWGDKTPRYIVHIDILNAFFPDARYIHLIRDGRDVAKSIVKRWWGANDFVTAMDSWARRIELGQKMLNMLPQERVMALRFEDLVEQPEHQIKKICDFLEVAFEKDMMDYTQSAASKVGGRITTHHSGLAQKPDVSCTYRWKRDLSKADQAIAYEVGGNMLKHYGYEPGETKSLLRLPNKFKHRIMREFNKQSRP